MTNAAELLVARKNTVAFIKADPLDIELRRPSFMDTDAGGRVEIEPTPYLASQRFRIVPLSGLVWDRSDPTPDEGRLPDITEALVGRHDADIQKNDWFAWDRDGVNGRYLVVHVSNFRHYRSQALIRFLEED